MTAPTKKSVFRATSLMGGVQLLNVLINIVRNKLAAILIGPTGMGLADLYARSADFLSQSTNFGIGISAVRELSTLHEQGDLRECAHRVRLIRTLTLWLALLGAVACLLAAPLLSRWSVGGSSITRGYWKLVPMVAFLTLTAGEMAILKATRRLRQIAVNMVVGALITLVLTAGFYYFLRMRGIVPVLLCSSAVMWLLTWRSTRQHYPYSLMMPRRDFFLQSRDILQAGMALLGAGVLGSGTEMVIRNFVVAHGTLSEAGLYAAGLTLTVTYTRVIFSAMDSDYYPRLAASIPHGQEVLSATVNRQIDVLVLLMAPALILFALCLPLVVQLLYTEDFLRVVPMVLAALCYMFLKAVYSPMAYLSLAAGDSRIYFLMELLYDVASCTLVMLGYVAYGLVGCGVALSLSNLLDLLVLWGFYHKRYKYTMQRTTLISVLLQWLLIMATLVVCAQDSLSMRILVGLPVFAVSACYSLYFFKR